MLKILVFNISLEKNNLMERAGTKTYLKGAAKAWLKNRNGTHRVVEVELQNDGTNGRQYGLYTAFDPDEELGYVLFDRQGYWIYDGNVLTVDEQEQVAEFIMTYIERV